MRWDCWSWVLPWAGNWGGYRGQHTRYGDGVGAADFARGEGFVAPAEGLEGHAAGRRKQTRVPLLRGVVAFQLGEALEMVVCGWFARWRRRRR